MSSSPVSPLDQTHRRVRLLLVDDMPQVLRDLRQLLELTGLVEIVAEAGDGLEAARLAGELVPEAVVMDLEMPGLNGYEATRRIRSQWPAMRVIILSVHAGPEEMEHARAAGADSFVVKGANYETLLRAIVTPAAPSSTGEANRHA
jgi:DNA-binding NarL/FixJ family response regulator